MKNPLRMIRKEKGLTISNMAALAGVSDMTIYKIEHGNLFNVTPDVLATLEKWGYDKEQFQQDYDEWKKQKVKELEAKFTVKS